MELINVALKIISAVGIEYAIPFLLLLLGAWAYGLLYKEYKREREKVDQLHAEKEKLHNDKLEMSQEMLNMANEYNEQMQNLTRETNNMITSLMAMFHVMGNNNKQ